MVEPAHRSRLRGVGQLICSITHEKMAHLIGILHHFGRQFRGQCRIVLQAHRLHLAEGKPVQKGGILPLNLLIKAGIVACAIALAIAAKRNMGFAFQRCTGEKRPERRLSPAATPGDVRSISLSSRSPP